jgi:hypothetical protein
MALNADIADNAVSKNSYKNKNPIKANHLILIVEVVIKTAAVVEKGA